MTPLAAGSDSPISCLPACLPGGWLAELAGGAVSCRAVYEGFRNAVMALLPYGMRSRISCAAWASSMRPGARMMTNRPDQAPVRHQLTQFIRQLLPRTLDYAFREAQALPYFGTGPMANTIPASNQSRICATAMNSLPTGFSMSPMGANSRKTWPRDSRTDAAWPARRQTL